MKWVGSLFVVVAIIVAFLGHSTTGDSSYLALQEENASNSIQRARDGLQVLVALVSGERIELARIQSDELRKKALELLKTHGRFDASQTAPHMISAKEEIAEAERKFERAKTERENSMKWYYVPSSFLCVLGLILLAIPTGKKQGPGSRV